MTSYIHDPDAVLDYEKSFAPWLAASETLTDVDVTITPEDTLSLGPTAASFTAQGVVTYWLADDGVDGTSYRINIHITTSQGREDDRSDLIIVRNR